MPNDYHCKSCELLFSTGWYHFHRRDDGFASATLLACSGCGTAYRVEHATGDGQSDRLLAQPEPVSEVAEDSYLNFKNFQEWQPCEVAGTLRPQREEHKALPAYFEAITDKLDLSQVVCHYCKSKGLLSAEWSADNGECPRCHKTALGCDSMWTT